ncbi:site-specific DNA-methyltransferase [Mucilaginibacter arboris]|uniref:site-specific DNA-methyltransferase (adenine-specific) n=1 Tax=Mucilaginibacter arboris TaxID=2682090 RepID=A0A7K1SU71_9SPHI|nr:site-specific DNA-methyltransferase [Mucilaginibacter arboris]MVN20803.1 site-specific DNA-methyltransferase [Mucilaginibacter arboris]
MPKQKHQKLELTWIGKGEEPKLEPRILIENPEYSYGDADTQNMIIHGDNLLALKALEQDYAGKIKCIYIDPPYNTGNAFEHYDDGIEHSLWLNLIKPRLTILRNLLSDEGSMWISIDDDESHYLKVLCDEVFGRINFVSNVIWEKKYSPQNDAKWMSDSHDHILVYAKSKEVWRPFLLPRTDEMNARYKNPDSDLRGVWKAADFSVKTYSVTNDYPITLPSGRIVKPPQSRCWVTSKERFEVLIKDNRIWFGESGNNVPSVKKFLSEVQDGIVSKTIWFRVEVGDNQDAKKEAKQFNSDNVFATPKPERLIQRILELSTKPNDLVLDSFLGSGTTAAVAHKMGRKWIGIELGEHAKTHCYPRLKQVVDGEQGGISKAVNWQGGGGFKFYTLAPSLLNQDQYGNWIISKEYNPQMLAAAMAKQEGFRYQPHQHVYWKQGQSAEQDFIFTTTQFLTVESLDRIHNEMQAGETLLICCKAFQQGCKNKYANISIKKIPQMLLGRCEFGKDDYSLNIVNMPVKEASEENEATISVQEIADQKSKKKSKNQQSLFE